MKATPLDEIFEVEKFNPYHDSKGRFTTSGAATSFTYSPGKSKAHDNAISREKDRIAGILPTEAQDKTLRGIESRTRNLKKEQLRVVDRDGNVIMQKQGGKHNVNFTRGEARDAFPGNISIHNHPDGGTFSGADLTAFGYGATEIRAAAPEGTYTLRNLSYGSKWNPNQKSWVEMQENLNTASEKFKSTTELRKDLRKPYDEQLQPYVKKWEALRASGAPIEEQKEIANEYTKTWDSLKPQLEAEVRAAYVGQYDSWYKSNAGSYGFEYTFTPTRTRTAKGDMMFDIDEIEKSSGEIVLDQQMQDDIEQIMANILRDYSRELPIEKAAPDIDEIEEVEKFNPYHDTKGRFSTANGATLFTNRTRDPNKQHWADNAIARENLRINGPEPEDTPQRRTILNTEDAIRHQDYESAAVIAPSGNTLFFKDGEVSHVDFTVQEGAMMKGNVMTHNHPASGVFSVEDIYCFTGNQMAEIRATNRSGITYSLKRVDGFTVDKGFRFADEYEKQMAVSIKTAQTKLDNLGYQNKIWYGEITQEQANTDFRGIINGMMRDWASGYAPKYGMNFSVEQRAVQKGVDEEMERTSKAAAADDGEVIVLDRDTEAGIQAAFNEWLESRNIKKEAPEVVEEESFSIFKTDDDKRLVFGWASVSIKVDGEQLEDRQQDLIDPDDLEEAAYAYVLNFRDTGERHNPNLRKKGKLVESCVFTVEKQKAMGIPEGILPVGWWIGFKIEDDEAWEKVKNGTYKMFSIEGKAVRVPVK